MKPTARPCRYTLGAHRDQPDAGRDAGPPRRRPGPGYPILRRLVRAIRCRRAPLRRSRGPVQRQEHLVRGLAAGRGALVGGKDKARLRCRDEPDPEWNPTIDRTDASQTGRRAAPDPLPDRRTGRRRGRSGPPRPRHGRRAGGQGPRPRLSAILTGRTQAVDGRSARLQHPRHVLAADPDGGRSPRRRRAGADGLRVLRGRSTLTASVQLIAVRGSVFPIFAPSVCCGRTARVLQTSKPVQDALSAGRP